MALMVEVIGVDHLYLAVSDLAVSEHFYDRVMIETLGFRKNTFVLGADPHVQYFNRHLGMVLRPARVPTRYAPYSPGLHHLCLQVDSGTDVKTVAARLSELGIEATEPKVYPEYAPDYVATFLEDPDGVRLEVTNYRQERRDRHDRWNERKTPSRADLPYPVATVADEAPPRTKASNYPEPFASRMAGRRKQPLGDLFGLSNFGVNLTRLAPGAASALRHAHSRQDEFVYVLQGHPTLHTDEGRRRLAPGMCAGFKAGTGNAHRLLNETEETVVYLEVGDRTPGDAGSYPDDDLEARLIDGKWKFLHKDGSPY